MLNKLNELKKVYRCLLPIDKNCGFIRIGLLIAVFYPILPFIFALFDFYDTGKTVVLAELSNGNAAIRTFGNSLILTQFIHIFIISTAAFFIATNLSHLCLKYLAKWETNTVKKIIGFFKNTNSNSGAVPSNAGTTGVKTNKSAFRGIGFLLAGLILAIIIEQYVVRYHNWPKLFSTTLLLISESMLLLGGAVYLGVKRIHSIFPANEGSYLSEAVNDWSEVKSYLESNETSESGFIRRMRHFGILNSISLKSKDAASLLTEVKSCNKILAGAQEALGPSESADNSDTSKPSRASSLQTVQTIRDEFRIVAATLLGYRFLKYYIYTVLTAVVIMLLFFIEAMWVPLTFKIIPLVYKDFPIHEAAFLFSAATSPPTMMVSFVGGLITIISAPLVGMGLFALLNILSSLFWRQRANAYDDLIFHFFASIWVLLLIVLQAYLGTKILELGLDKGQALDFMNNLRTELGLSSGLQPIPDSIDFSLKPFIETVEQLFFPYGSGSDTSRISVLGMNPASKGLLALRLGLYGLVAVALWQTTSFFTRRYEALIRKRSREGQMSIPAELIHIVFGFLIFAIVSAQIYMAMYYSFYPVDSLPDPTGIASITTSQSGQSSQISFVPYSVVLALVGTLLAISTRDLLENYFSGLSLQVSPPFVENDRVVIGDSGMCEVKEIGPRVTKLYDVANNSHIYIPHRKIAHASINNYTQPSLDYRRSISIFVQSLSIETVNQQYNRLPFPNQLGPLIQKMNLLERAEAMLLLAAFRTTGVKRPLVSLSKPQNGKDIKDEIAEFAAAIKSKDSNEIINKANHLLKSMLGEKQDQSDNSTVKFSFLRNIIELHTRIHSDLSQDPTDEIQAMNHITVLSICLLSEAEIIRRFVKLSDDDQDQEKGKEIAKGCEARETIFNEALKTLQKTGHLDPPPPLYDENFNQAHNVAAMGLRAIWVSFFYFAISELLWRVRENLLDKSFISREIDHAMLDLLNAPRVQSKQVSTATGLMWEISLVVLVELAEQSDEIMHHITSRASTRWSVFGLPQ